MAVATEMLDPSRFLREWGFDISDAYEFADLKALPFEEGPIDEGTFLKYGIITAVSYQDAIRRYWDGRWFSAQTIQALCKPVEAI